MDFFPYLHIAGFLILGTLGGYLGLRSYPNKVWLLSMAPFIFAVGLLVELFIHIGISGYKTTFLQFFTEVVYLGLTSFLWPLWISGSLFFGESSGLRKRVLYYLFLFAVAISCLSASYLFRREVSLSTVLVVHHGMNTTLIPSVVRFFYFLASTLPFFISSFALVWLAGVAGVTATFFLLLFQKVAFLWLLFTIMMNLLVAFLIWFHLRAEGK